MIRINLLPHRDMRRTAKLRQFTGLLAFSALAAVALTTLIYLTLSARIDVQQQRNEFLKAQIAKLNKNISDIKELKQQTKDLLARKQVVESLQSNRSYDVHLLDQLVRLMPEGMYLNSIEQHDATIHLNGLAQSSARVSTLMRNLDSSQWLKNATLIEVKTATVQNIQANEFSLDVQMTSPEEAHTPSMAAQNTYAPRSGKAE